MKTLKAKIGRITNKQKLEELFSVVDLCLIALNEDDPKEIANKTNLCLSTIRRLVMHEFTIAIHVGTLQSLAYAAGLTVSINPDGSTRLSVD